MCAEQGNSVVFASLKDIITNGRSDYANNKIDFRL